MSYSCAESVTDINDVIRSLTQSLAVLKEELGTTKSEVASLNRQSTRQQVEIKQLKRENARLKSENDHLNEQVALLTGVPVEQPAAAPPRKNSANSSTPPTQQAIDDQIAFKSRSLRKPSGKPSGGQPGHKGHGLSRTDDPTRVESHQPKVCPHCGSPIPDIAERTCTKRTQVVDIAGVLEAPTVTEHRRISTVCPHCGKTAHGNMPTGKCRNVTYGPKLQTLVVYLSVVHSIPYARICEIVRDVYCVEHFSEGSVKNILKRNSDKASPTYNGILDFIDKQNAVGMDETGVYVNAKLCWFWCVQCPNFCYVFADESRGIKALEGHNIIPHLEGLTLYTDRHGTYFKLDVKNHQVCLAHLLRDLQYLNDLNKQQHWSADVQNLFREAIRYHRDNPPDAAAKKRFGDRATALLDEDLSSLPREFQVMQNGLYNCKDYLFTFLAEDDVPPDNNSSERAIRVLKVKGKVSGGFRTPDGADEFACFHSIAETAKRNGIAKFRALYNLISEMSPGKDFLEKLINAEQ